MTSEMKTSWWDTHKPSKRKIIQLYSALLYNAHLRGFAEGTIFTGKTKTICVPGFNCYSCPGAVGACPLGALQNALGSLDKHIGFYVLGIILLYGMLLGRTICGWVCPLGLIQEILHRIPTPKIQKSRITRGLSYLKYVMLAVFAVAIPVYYGILKGIPVPGFCKYICPAGTFEGAMGMLPNNLQWLSMLDIVFTRKFVIMVMIFTVCIFCYRAFCRFLCPLGAIYGMFSRLAVIGVKVDDGRCNGCSACIRKCKMDVKAVGDHECIHCAKCIAHCRQGAISMKAGKYTLIASFKKEEAVENPAKKYVWAGAAAILAALIIWVNFLDPSLKLSSNAGAENVGAENAGITETAVAYESDAPIGYEPGSRLADFEINCLDGTTFALSQTKGKVVFINLWATYCGPCVKELPHFNELYHEHQDDIEILAVHASLTTEDVNEYLADKGWDIHFAVDDEKDTLFGIVNGSLALPQTIVLNRKGEVIYNKVGSMTPEMLDHLYNEACGDQN